MWLLITIRNETWIHDNNLKTEIHLKQRSVKGNPLQKKEKLLLGRDNCFLEQSLSYLYRWSWRRKTITRAYYAFNTWRHKLGKNFQINNVRPTQWAFSYLTHQRMSWTKFTNRNLKCRFIAFINRINFLFFFKLWVWLKWQIIVEY